MKGFKKVGRINRDKNGQYPKSIAQQIREAKKFEAQYFIATEAHHQFLGDISREYVEGDPDNLCIINSMIEGFYIGSWVTGIGAFNVMFPIKTTMRPTGYEIQKFKDLQVYLGYCPYPISVDISKNTIFDI